jgi:hypothetical protein
MELPDDARSIRSHVAVHVVASYVSGWFVNPDDMSDANLVFLKMPRACPVDFHAGRLHGADA